MENGGRKRKGVVGGRFYDVIVSRGLKRLRSSRYICTSICTCSLAQSIPKYHRLNRLPTQRLLRHPFHLLRRKRLDQLIKRELVLLPCSNQHGDEFLRITVPHAAADVCAAGVDGFEDAG